MPPILIEPVTDLMSCDRSEASKVKEYEVVRVIAVRVEGRKLQDPCGKDNLM